MSDSRPGDILDYWFGDSSARSSYFEERVPFWFYGGPKVDAHIRREFEKDVIAAAEGALSSWENDPRTCLALIVLLDQFSLNLYRDQPRSFLQSAQAIPIAERAIARGFDQAVRPHERVFYYLPFEHAEDIPHQNRAVRLFEQLLRDAPEDQKGVFQSFLEYAIAHQEVVVRFGRFPDRNPVFGRPHRPEEAAYMEAGGPPF